MRHLRYPCLTVQQAIVAVVLFTIKTVEGVIAAIRLIQKQLLILALWVENGARVWIAAMLAILAILLNRESSLGNSKSGYAMKHLNWGWILLLSLLAAPALAAVNKCVEESGRIFYQAEPCPANTHGGDLRLNVNRPFTGQAKRPTTEGTSAATTEYTDAPLAHEPTPKTPQPQDGEQ